MFWLNTPGIGGGHRHRRRLCRTGRARHERHRTSRSAEVDRPRAIVICVRLIAPSGWPMALLWPNAVLRSSRVGDGREVVHAHRFTGIGEDGCGVVLRAAAGRHRRQQEPSHRELFDHFCLQDGSEHRPMDVIGRRC
jgi:hypothetical protein